MENRNVSKIKQLLERRAAIETEIPGDDVRDMDAWQQHRRQRLQDIDAQLSDLRNDAGRNVGEFEKR